MNKLGVMVGAKDDVLENGVLIGDDSRDDTEGGDERADAYTSNNEEDV